jgi:hypothetical protein
MKRTEGKYAQQNAEIIRMIKKCAKERKFSKKCEVLTDEGELRTVIKTELYDEDLAKFLGIDDMNTFKYRIRNALKIDAFSIDEQMKMYNYVCEDKDYFVLKECIKNTLIYRVDCYEKDDEDKANKEHDKNIRKIRTKHNGLRERFSALQLISSTWIVVYITSIKELEDLLSNRPKKISICITQDCYKEAVILIENWYCLDRNTANFEDTLHIELHAVSFQIPFTVVAGISADDSLVGIMYDDRQECYVPLSETGLWLMQNSIDKIQEQIPIYKLFKYPVTRAVYKIFCKYDGISPALMRLLANYVLSNEVTIQEQVGCDFEAALNCIQNDELRNEFRSVTSYFGFRNM